jgi:ABC-type antimicrobial peptide transport system permease subunit
LSRVTRDSAKTAAEAVQASAGLAVGVVAALATVRVVKTLLFGVTPQDPLTLAGAGASLIAIAVLACWVRAARAARVDPVIAFRGE